MIYRVASEFLKINETSGTIQNTSHVHTLEISDKAESDSGILLFPLNQFTFSGEKYLRCIDNGTIAVRVVSFSNHTSGDSYSDDDPNALIEDIWNNPNTGDSDDPFIDDLNNIFNP